MQPAVGNAWWSNNNTGCPKDKTHLIAWRKRVGEQKAQEITTEDGCRHTHAQIS